MTSSAPNSTAGHVPVIGVRAVAPGSHDPPGRDPAWHAGPGGRSGGYYAALLAEVTGPDGQVTSIDIDPGVTAAAATALDAAGYAGRVTVITGNTEHGVPGHAPFNAVIVTAGVPGIAPS
jgi:hypothetical protein